MSKVKRKAILEDLRKTKENYSEVNEGIAKIRVNLDTIELKTAEEVDNFDKAINLFEALPEEQVSNPSSVLDSLLSSGSYLAKSAHEHSEHFKDKFVTYIRETDLLLGTTTVSNTSSNIILNVAVSAAKTAALQYPQVKELIREQNLPSRTEKRNKLESELKKLDERLANIYVGVWQTFRDTSKKDRYRQAAHSMRDLVTLFLNHLAYDIYVYRHGGPNKPN